MADTVAAARSINAAFGALFTDEASNRVFTTILALLALFFSFYEAATDSSGRERAEASQRAHDDAVSMRDALDRHAGVLEQIRDELAQRPPAPPAASPLPVPSASVATGTMVRARGPNRHSRRTAQARARKSRHPESPAR